MWLLASTLACYEILEPMVRLIRRYFGGICSHLYVISIIYMFIVNKKTSNNNLLNTYLCQAHELSWIVQWITHVVVVSLQKLYEVRVTHSRSHSQRGEDLESEPRSDRIQTPPSGIFVKYCYSCNLWLERKLWKLIEERGLGMWDNRFLFIASC